jgi:EmrB/QacA subfamily drug resistance transporter
LSHAIRLPCEAGAIRSGTAPAPVSGTGTWVLAATIIGSSLAFIDGTVVTVALPAIGREFHAGTADLQWVVEAYSLFLSALLLVGGALGDRYGRKRVFATGVASFALASAACAAAPSMAVLLAARALQGIGAALLVPGSLALLSASFAPEERGRAIGTWSGFSGITTAVGPLLGGWLVSHSWRWAFLLNLPLALGVLLLLTRVPESHDPGARRLDPAGAVFATLALGGIVYGLIESSRRGWGDGAVLSGLVGGTVALAAFVLVESRAPAPMLPFTLFRSREFTAANLLTFCLYGALSTVFFFLPLELIQRHGYSPLGAGAALLPFILILFALSRWSGGLVTRFGARRPLILGPLVAGLGFAALSLMSEGGGYARDVLPGMIVLGLGMALSVAPLTTTVMNAASPENAGIASGVNNAVSRAAGLVAIALLGIVSRAEGFRAVGFASAGLALLAAACAGLGMGDRLAKSGWDRDSHAP